MKQLSGRELAEYIMERQAREVRALRQAWHIQPKLAIVAAANDLDDLSIQAQQAYGADIRVDVDVRRVTRDTIRIAVSGLNAVVGVHGILVYPETAVPQTGLVAPDKDVDALGADAVFDPAVRTAVLWLLAGYNIDPKQGKKVIFFDSSGTESRALDEVLKDTGVEVVRAGSGADPEITAPEADVVIAGIEPLAVCAVFENVIRAAHRVAEAQ